MTIVVGHAREAWIGHTCIFKRTQAIVSPPETPYSPAALFLRPHATVLCCAVQLSRLDLLEFRVRDGLIRWGVGSTGGVGVGGMDTPVGLGWMQANDAEAGGEDGLDTPLMSEVTLRSPDEGRPLSTNRHNLPPPQVSFLHVALNPRRSNRLP